MADKYHVTIIGGGLAGLSLGFWLKRFNPRISLDILESRESLEHDRHWSFWHHKNLPSHLQPFEQCFSRSFAEFSVGSLVDAKDWRYSVVRSEAFYRKALSEVGSHVRFGIACDDQAVREFRSSNDHFVFDSRPPPAPTGAIWQQFYGWLIEAPSDEFVGQNCRIMEFIDEVGEALTAFFYVLPLSENRVLLEPTVFTEKLLPRHCFDQWRTNWLEGHCIKDYNLLEEETGCLPMSTALYSTDSFHIPIGTRAGWLRASSGYAFERTQYFSEKLARHIVLSQSHPRPERLRFPGYIRWMDSVFLRVMRRYPQLIPKIIEAWFARVPPDRLLPFLQGDPRVSDLLLLISQTPYKSKFLRCCL